MVLISILLGLLLMTFPGPAPSASDSNGELMLTDFTSASSDLGWYVVNDNVMGGRSEGRFELRQGEQAQGELSFTGRTNTNGGGFSSIRTKTLQLDLSTFDGIRLRVNGDGRRYTWRLTSTARWRGGPMGWPKFFIKNCGTPPWARPRWRSVWSPPSPWWPRRLRWSRRGCRIFD